MNDLLKRLEDKLDKLDEKLDGLDKSMVVNNLILQEHIRRTELNEARIQQVEDQLIPISNHVHFVTTIPSKIGKAVYFISVVITIMTGLSALGWYFVK